MKNKILLVLLILVVIGTISAVSFFITKGSAKPQMYEVTLTEAGFTPEKLTIKQGDKVTFKTTRGKFFWPASNLHPTHLIYSDFDPKDPVDPKTAWSFTFERKGIWKYHDHLSPYYTGVIEVD